MKKSNLINKEFDSQMVNDNSDKYIKTKTKNL